MKQIIGFIGTGVMGASMVRNLLQAGYTVYVYNRSPEKAQALTTYGAVFCETIAELTIQSDIVMTMVGYPQDVESIYFRADGIFANCKSGAIFIDFTTSTPTLAKKIYEKAKEIGAAALDAPVSGGDIGAQNATLTIMVGGDADIFANCKPIFEVLGTNVQLQGGAGAGQHTKVVNQIAGFGNLLAMVECIFYAKNAGLDPKKVLSSISTGASASWALTNLAPRILNNDFEPGFFIKHCMKDMRITLEEAEKMQISCPTTKLAYQMFEDMDLENKGEYGTQALYRYYEAKFQEKK